MIDNEDKEFPEEIWEEAKTLASLYNVSIKRIKTGFEGYCIEMPKVSIQHDNMIQCHIILRWKIAVTLAVFLEKNQDLPKIKTNETTTKLTETISQEILSGQKEIKITDVNQIIDKMINDGDLREHDFGIQKLICCEDDDLGFYQQSCEFLINERCKLIKELKNDRK